MFLHEGTPGLNHSRTTYFPLKSPKRVRLAVRIGEGKGGRGRADLGRFSGLERAGADGGESEQDQCFFS